MMLVAVTSERLYTAAQALCLATGKSMQKIKDDYAEAGDLGNVAAAARAKQKTMFKPKPLTVQGVFKCVLVP